MGSERAKYQKIKPPMVSAGIHAAESFCKE